MLAVGALGDKLVGRLSEDATDISRISLYRLRWSIVAFLKLWSADHKWSSGTALVVLLD